MASYSDIKTRVSNDLVRPGLLTEIGYAINEAIRDYSSTRFWFNQSRTLTFNTVASQTFYTSSDNASIPKLVTIDKCIVYQSAAPYECDWKDNWELDATDDGTARGLPYWYSYFNMQIRFYPIPDNIYSTRIVGIIRPDDLSADSDTNVFTQYADTLIRLSAKRRIYAEIMKDEAKASTEANLEQLELSRLLRETTMQAGPVAIEYEQF